MLTQKRKETTIHIPHKSYVIVHQNGHDHSKFLIFRNYEFVQNESHCPIKQMYFFSFQDLPFSGELLETQNTSYIKKTQNSEYFKIPNLLNLNQNKLNSIGQ